MNVRDRSRRTSSFKRGLPANKVGKKRHNRIPGGDGRHFQAGVNAQGTARQRRGDMTDWLLPAQPPCQEGAGGGTGEESTGGDCPTGGGGRGTERRKRREAEEERLDDLLASVETMCPSSTDSQRRRESGVRERARGAAHTGCRPSRRQIEGSTYRHGSKKSTAATRPKRAERQTAPVQFTRLEHVTWNTRSLHYGAKDMAGRGKARRKARNVIALANGTDVLSLQETRLNKDEDKAFRTSLPRHDIFYANDGEGALGMLTALGPKVKAAFQLRQVPTPPALRARALLVKGTHRHGGEDFMTLNVHLPNDTADQATFLADLLAWEPLLTGERVYLVGDFNFVLGGDDSSNGNVGSLTGKVRGAWERLSRRLRLTEIDQPTHTWFALGADHITGVSKRLDRIYVTMDAAEAAVNQPSAFIASSPFSLLGSYRSADLKDMQSAACEEGEVRRKAIANSDHLPVGCRWDLVQTRRPKKSDVPGWVAKDPLFPKAFNDNLFYEEHYDFRDKLVAFKTAARAAKKEVLRAKADKAVALTDSYNQFQTAVALLGSLTEGRQDSGRAKALMTKYPHLAGLVDLDTGDAKPLREFINRLVAEDMECDVLLDAAAPAEMEEDADIFRAPSSGRQGPVRLSAVQRLKLLLPSTRGRLPGLRAEIDGELITDPKAMALLAQKDWQELWAEAKPVKGSTAAVRNFMSSFSAKIPVELRPAIPSTDTIEGVILSSNNSCAGPDGLAFQVYRTMSAAFAPILRELLVALSEGEVPPDDFNEALLFLLSKGGTLTPMDCRPLAVTNTDNRLLAKCMVLVTTPALNAVIGDHQQGFLKGRRGDTHIKETNRLFYQSVKDKGRAFHLLFLDQRKAYDSVHHSWLHESMRAIGFPDWVLNVMAAMLTKVRVTPLFGDRVDVWISILRGVRQGCPWSPLLFLVAYEPLLCRIALFLPGVKRFAFADDLGCGTYDLQDLSGVMRIMSLFEKASGLGSNVSKCVLISSKHVPEDYARWVATGTVPWGVGTKAGFAIKHAHKYLGILMGMLVDQEEVYRETVDKMVTRFLSYRSSLRMLSMHKRILSWNVFVASIPVYLQGYFLFPSGSGKAKALTRLRKAVRDVIIPWGGTGFPYHALLGTRTGLGAGLPLIDVWATSVARLAEKAELGDLDGMTLAELKVLRAKGGTTMLYDDQVRQAALTVACSHMSGAGAPGLFDSKTFAGIDDQARRRAIYDRLVVVTFRPSQDKDVVTKLKRRGCTTTADSASWVRRHHSLLPAKLSWLRYHQFGMLHNSLFSRRRFLPVEVPDPTMRERIVPVPCWLCGQADDGVEHVFGGTCVVVNAARQIFAGTSGVDVTVEGTSAGSEADGAYFNYAPVSATVTTAAFCFNKAVWMESQGYFRTLGRPTSAEATARRLADVANSVWEENRRWLVRGAGKKKKRSPAQKVAAFKGAMEVVARLVKGGIFAYTDGASIDNPGPAGAGVFFDEAGVDLPAQAWALGKASNNVAELFAIGAAAESIQLARMHGLAEDERAFILTDSDNGLGRISKPWEEGEELLLTRVRQAVHRCRAQGPLGLIWVPGHCGVPGNEEADGEASEGAMCSIRSGFRAEATGDTVGGWDFITPDKAAAIVAAIHRRRGSTELGVGGDDQGERWPRWPDEAEDHWDSESSDSEEGLEGAEGASQGW